MARLLPAELRLRRAFDYRVIQGLRSDHLGRIRAYTSDEAYQAGVVAGDQEGAAGLVRHYVVPFNFPILIGAGKTTPGVVVKFDLQTCSNYPFAPPMVTCLGEPRPWSPHVHPTSGVVCLGGGWSAAHGRMLAAQLFIHVMRLLNCDEPGSGDSYGGWNAAAVQYWRTVLKCQPLNPELGYPVLPSDVTHLVEDSRCTFKSADEVSVLVPAREELDTGEFLSLGIEPVDEGIEQDLFFRSLAAESDANDDDVLKLGEEVNLGGFRPLGGGP
jgi:ubiquitin-protein ligase